MPVSAVAEVEKGKRLNKPVPRFHNNTDEEEEGLLLPPLAFYRLEVNPKPRLEMLPTTQEVSGNGTQLSHGIVLSWIG